MHIQEYLARTLCKSSCNMEECPICERYGIPCQMWYTFLNESNACIKAFKNYYILTPRKKPKNV